MKYAIPCSGANHAAYKNERDWTNATSAIIESNGIVVSGDRRLVGYLCTCCSRKRTVVAEEMDLMKIVSGLKIQIASLEEKLTLRG